MNRIEKGTPQHSFQPDLGLHALHAENREAEQASQVQQAAASTPVPARSVAPQLIPFALVNSVFDSSPAAEAVSSPNHNH
jgi:hypothetical protein